MLKQYEQLHDLNQTVTILHALKWANISWHFNLTNTTIYRYFQKAKIQPV